MITWLWITSTLLVSVSLWLILSIAMRWGSVGDSDIKWPLRLSILALLSMAVSMTAKAVGW